MLGLQKHLVVPHNVASVAFINLDEDLDPFMWSLQKGGFFIDKSYSYIVNNGVKVTQEI